MKQKIFAKRQLADSCKTAADYIKHYISMPATHYHTFKQLQETILRDMPRDVPDTQGKLLDALSMCQLPNENPSLFASRVKAAAKDEWQNLPE
ncbi:unnamed protein product [Allacma fusca]|uniref:Uncharacterized protein n=1 Tax=Allacma fusca TaxID=39272 RepID=A0A8J2KDR7_9HEXA|nr:unnamed protein product [Allacma fusca]